MNLFRSNRPADATVDTVDAAPANAGYVQGQRDAHAADRAVLNERSSVVRHAYDRGRRDERARARPRRHGFGLFGLVVLVAAVIGAGAIYLGVSQGSFTRGGQVVDQKITTAEQPARNAADKAGDALENAGQRIKQQAGSGS
jgi:hypothetical protein